MSAQHLSKLDSGLEVLYPGSGEEPLTGLYLCEDLRASIPRAGTYIYTNFISSLDGRIALESSETGQLEVPQNTTNIRDWRLFLELAAPADAVIVSGSYLNALADDPSSAGPPFSGEAPPDLIEFRQALGLERQPALVVVTRSLKVPVEALVRLAGRRVILATVIEAPEPAAEDLRTAGIEVLRLGPKSVDAGRLAAALAERGMGLVYSIAGPAVLHMLLSARVLQRIYLTTVLRILAGEAYASLAQGSVLDPPYDFRLAALYLDRHGPDGVEQLLQVYDRREAAPTESP